MVDPADLALQVGYEVDAMVRTAIRIDTTNGDAIVENALLEATLLHCRNLIEFLGDKHQKDDIVPEDFVAGWAPAMAQLPPDALKAIHKHLAHLTKTRVTDGKIGWAFPRLAETVLEGMWRFVEHCEKSGGSPGPTTILRNHLHVAEQTIEGRIAQLTESTTTTDLHFPTTSTGDVLSLGDFS